MNSEDCLKVINKINDCLKENLWMDFEMCKMNEGNIVLSGMLDELDDEIIEISFIQPFMCSCALRFTYDEGEFISLIQGESAIEINKKYKVEQGNYIFSISIDGCNDYFIIAKEIQVRIAK